MSEKKLNSRSSWLDLARGLKAIQREHQDTQGEDHGKKRTGGSWDLFDEKPHILNAHDSHPVWTRYSFSFADVVSLLRPNIPPIEYENGNEESHPEAKGLEMLLRERAAGCVVLDLAGPGKVFEHMNELNIPLAAGFSVTAGNESENLPQVADLTLPDAPSHIQIRGNLLFHSTLNKMTEVIQTSAHPRLTDTLFLPFGGWVFLPRGFAPRDYQWFFQLMQSIWENTSPNHGRIFFQVPSYFYKNILFVWKELFAVNGDTVPFVFDQQRRSTEMGAIVAILERTPSGPDKLPKLSDAVLDELIQEREQAHS